MAGDPFEVAEKATLQAAGLARLLMKAIEDANIMARNADLERQLQESEECSCDEWESLRNPQAKYFKQSFRNAESVAMALEVLSRAAGYNPRKPPKA